MPGAVEVFDAEGVDCYGSDAGFVAYFEDLGAHVSFNVVISYDPMPKVRIFPGPSPVELEPKSI